MNYSSRNQPSSMPCPNCRRLISVTSTECIYCGLKNPRLYTRIPLLTSLLRGELSFVNGIIIVCFGLYVASLALNFSGTLQSTNPLMLLSPANQSLYQLGMGGRLPLSQGRWWTLITATYLHGSILHILFNMLWLRQIGPLVENLFGASRFIILYTVAGLVGSALSTFLGTPLFVGASGAIFGLFGALIYYGRSRGGTFGSAIFRQMLFWAGLNFIFGFTVANVDNWGHLGGLVGGLVVAWLMGYQEKSRQTLWQHLMALATLAGISVCFAFMLVYFFK